MNLSKDGRWNWIQIVHSGSYFSIGGVETFGSTGEPAILSWLRCQTYCFFLNLLKDDFSTEQFK
jgi:hypothetical protein